MYAYYRHPCSKEFWYTGVGKDGMDQVDFENVCCVARCGWLDAPMPTEMDWTDGSPCVRQYIEWREARGLSIELTPETWSEYCVARADEWCKEMKCLLIRDF